MCDFNNLDDAAKTLYHEQLTECAKSFGGTNFFLHILDAVRKTKPSPLMAKNCTFSFSHGTIKWNKVIFQDKLALLAKIRIEESKTGNLLPNKGDKSYKTVMNLLRTLHPIEFKIKPKNREDGEGFTLHPFDIIDENTTRLNPLFDAVFFCSTDTVKKVLNYTPKAS